MKKTNSRTTKLTPVLIIHHPRTHGENNALFMDKSSNRFFLCETEREAVEGEPREITLIEGLEWYVKYFPDSTDSQGDIVPLAKLAAHQLSRGGA